jgi:uncharacterized membrane protein YsdA (DUF1294 family)
MFELFSETAASRMLYVDPGTGSLVVQIILGGVAGALVAGKLFWHRIAAALRFRSAGNGGKKRS